MEQQQEEGPPPPFHQDPHKLPRWHYDGTQPQLHSHLPNESVFTLPDPNVFSMGSYCRESVTTNIDRHPTGRAHFDFGLRLMLSYQHEMASKCFLAALQYCPDAALIHGLVALCHSPNYNFKGEPYYESACHFEEADRHDLLCIFPSQQVADRHSKAAIVKMEEIKRLHKQQQPQRNKKKGNKGRNRQQASNKQPTEEQRGDKQQTQPELPDRISDVEAQVLAAIRILTCSPGVDATLSDEIVGRPYMHAMRKVYQAHPQDPEIAYFFAESLMVLNAWKLYEYPSGKPLSSDVVETRNVLERSLQIHPHHAGLCHMYVHLSEMSAQPELALPACVPLRTEFPHAGHLIHMPTHIDVLIGDYESCVRYNVHAIAADLHVMETSPATAGKESFYFGYIVHNFHMAVYGAILGAMEAKAMELSIQLNAIVNEDMFLEFPNIVAYLEAYSALEIHTMVRFGRWKEILQVGFPKDKNLMLYRTASIRYARALAYAMMGNVREAYKEADRLDCLRRDHPDVEVRILHNNSVASLLAVDSVMMRGEIAYRDGKYGEGLNLLRKAVDMQDSLNYDEPWGKMQPIRHALGGLLLEQGQLDEATSVFRKDLQFHPRNPWALVGLIRCLKLRNLESGGKCCASDEIVQLEEQLRVQRQMEWADYDVIVACECCTHPESKPVV